LISNWVSFGGIFKYEGVAKKLKKLSIISISSLYRNKIKFKTPMAIKKIRNPNS